MSNPLRNTCLREKYLGFLLPGRWPEIRMIVEAIERGDGDAALAVMERVIHEGYDRFIRTLG